jgi:hypothetical protein
MVLHSAVADISIGKRGWVVGQDFPMTDAHPSKQISYLTFTIDNFNPNHKIRFVAFGNPPCHLFDLASAVGDDSFYLAPLLSRPITVHRAGGFAGLVEVAGGPSHQIHLSFHESGAVNLHIGNSNLRVRSKLAGRAASGLVVRLAFGSLDVFRHVPFDKLVSVPGGTTPVPVPGFWGAAPVCIDVYQVDLTTPWTTPVLGDTIQIDACVKLKRKASAYHFLMWQHTQAKPQGADLTVYFSPRKRKVF